MSRVQLVSAMAFDAASYDSSGVGDPSLRVLGELPGGAEPFRINRVYLGPQGVYEEVLALADPEGLIIWESSPRLVELRGMMFEDLFRRSVTDPIEITSLGEHTLVCYLDGAIAGRIPVFIDAPESAKGAGVLLEAAEAALKKGSICWLRTPQLDGRELSRPAWYVQQGSKLFVIKGDGEQQLPNLERCDEVTIDVKSKAVKAAIGALEATVRVVTDAEEFERIATLGLGTRLNLRDGQDALERWKRDCTLVELTPRG